MKTLDVLNEYKAYIKIIERRPNGREKDAEKAQIIIDALEKQIPKKPRKDEYGYYVCSCCGADEYALMHDSNIANKYNFCHNCGQKLDWSEEK